MRDELIHDDRRLPRPTRIALSRLKKDLWMATRLQDRVVADIVCALPIGVEFEQLLVNLDMIDRSELKGDVVRVMWAANTGDRELLAMLKRLYLADDLALTDLPEAARSSVARERKAGECRDNPARFLGALDAMEDKDEYREHLLIALTVFPDLLRASGGEDATRIVELIKRHKQPSDGFVWRAELLADVLGDLESYDLATPLVGVVTSSGRAIRQRVMQVFDAMEALSLPILMRILTETDRTAVCNDAAVTLARIATPDWLVGQLSSKTLRPHTAHYLLKVLGEIGDVRHAVGIKGYLRHSEPKVRDAAVEAAFLLGGEKALPVLLRAIYDPNPDLICRAIHFLERLDYKDGRYVKRLLKFVTPPSEEGEEATKPAPELVQVAAIRALARMGSLKLGQQGTLEEHLLKVLPAPDKWKRFAIWRQTEETVSEDVRMAVCDALARIGGQASMARLNDQSGEPEQRVRVRMSRSAAAIERRLTGEG